jgi:hypothetical protein
MAAPSSPVFRVAPALRTAGLARGLFASALVVQALAHSSPAIWLTYYLPSWFVTPLWLVATTCLFGAAFGLLGMRPFAERWRILAAVGALASILLLGSTSLQLAVLGAALDAPLLVLASSWHPGESRHGGHIVARTRWRVAVRRVGAGIAWLVFAYVSVAIVSRPWHVNWGTSVAERRMPLPGDDVVPNARYRMDHAVTIAAPADSVWPWLVQIGQDRGGFYSYSWLERLIGDDVRNADRIHPEWQRREVGDLVRAAQPDYAGGVFGRDLGWRVLELQPGRAIVLENWGAFVLRPQDDGTTRFHIRLRGPGTPSLLGIVLGPLNAFVFEPAHFVMERGMMLGIKRRAEELVVR